MYLSHFGIYRYVPRKKFPVNLRNHWRSILPDEYEKILNSHPKITRFYSSSESTDLKDFRAGAIDLAMIVAAVDARSYVLYHQVNEKVL